MVKEYNMKENNIIKTFKKLEDLVCYMDTKYSVPGSREDFDASEVVFDVYNKNAYLTCTATVRTDKKRSHLYKYILELRVNGHGYKSEGFSVRECCYSMLLTCDAYFDASEIDALLELDFDFN